MIGGEVKDVGVVEEGSGEALTGDEGKEVG